MSAPEPAATGLAVILFFSCRKVFVHWVVTYCNLGICTKPRQGQVPLGKRLSNYSEVRSKSEKQRLRWEVAWAYLVQFSLVFSI